MSVARNASVVRYYRGVFARAARDARAQITRTGLVAGSVLTIAVGYVQSQLDQEADFGSVALAALIAAVALALLFFARHLFRAPVALLTDERVRLGAETDEAVATKQGEIATRDDEIATLRAQLDECKTTLDHEAPKLALIEQLRKLYSIASMSLLTSIGKSEDQQRELLEKDAEAANAWDFETREIIRRDVPQHMSDFNKGPSLPIGFLGLEPDPPSIQEILAWKAARQEALGGIIKDL